MLINSIDRMFDLNYLNNLKKKKKWMDEFKGNLFSRQNSSILRIYQITS
jgi:hypothetical protein